MTAKPPVMRKLLFIPILFLSLNMNAQHYVRTKHNFGITASYNFIDDTRLQNSFRGIGQGNSFGIGITHEWKNFLYPELFFTQHSGTFPVTPESPYGAASYKLNGIGAGLTAKIDLFSFDNKKKKGYCFGRVLDLIFGGDYVHNFGFNPADDFAKPQNEIDGKIGLGMYSEWGGSSKSHEAWTIHWEAYYKYGFTPFMEIKNYAADGNSQSFTHNSIGITLRVMHFKTYKFSEM